MEYVNPYHYVRKCLLGKWKMTILNHIHHYGCIRFNETRKTLPISEKVLAEQLRELALDGLVERIQYNTIPLKVEYVLTRQGRELMPILDSLYIWSIRRMHELGISIDPDAFVVHTGDAFSEALGDIMADLGYDEDGLPVEKETTEDSDHE